MKRFLFSAGITCLIFLVFGGFKSITLKNAAMILPAAELSCPPALTNVEAAAFVIPEVPSAVMIRKSVYSLSAAEINSLKAGISAMKALPVADPTSWQYQAAIHGTTLAGNMPSWNSCQHGNQFFLSWHRMYIYFFERILRAKSGNPNLTVPYWNYQINPVLHPDYRNSAAGNTLYDASRNASINAGGSLNAAIMASINTALGNVPFLSFQSSLNGPHGSVHTSIGGNMGAVDKAGKDPVFWLHHANIDRLWEAWLKKCGGRANPTTAPWTTQVFTFFDENGKAVNMTGSQVVKVAAQLNYRYDSPVIFLPCNFVNWKIQATRMISFTKPFKLTEKITRLSILDAKSDSLDLSIRRDRFEKFTFSDTGASDRIFIEMDNITVNKAPEGIIEVYLNLPPNETPNPASKSFAGVLDLFTPTGSGHQHDNGNQIQVDVTNAVRALRLSVKDLKNVNFTFAVRGNTLNGREIQTRADVQVQNVHVVVQRVSR